MRGCIKKLPYEGNRKFPTTQLVGNYYPSHKTQKAFVQKIQNAHKNNMKYALKLIYQKKGEISEEG